MATGRWSATNSPNERTGTGYLPGSTALTSEQVASATNRLENLTGDRRATALRMLPQAALDALFDEMLARTIGDGGSDAAVAAHEAALIELERRSMIRAENQAIADAKAARRDELAKVAAGFARGVEVIVPNRGEMGRLITPGRMKAADIVDGDDFRDGWKFRDGWHVGWGAKCDGSAWFSNDELAAAQISGRDRLVDAHEDVR